LEVVVLLRQVEVGDHQFLQEKVEEVLLVGEVLLMVGVRGVLPTVVEEGALLVALLIVGVLRVVVQKEVQVDVILGVEEERMVEQDDEEEELIVFVVLFWQLHHLSFLDPFVVVLIFFLNLHQRLE